MVFVVGGVKRQRERERRTVVGFLFCLVDKASGYVGVTVAYRRRGSRSGIGACLPQ